MKQYHDLLKSILTKGTKKAPARPGMPGSISLFGYQNRYDLQAGFPILTTKKVSFKNIVVELLWFLRGYTNIKYLVDNGCNIWNEDAYNYYLKKCKEFQVEPMSFENFEDSIKKGHMASLVTFKGANYMLGDTGKQYGWLWRKWNGIDQLTNLINGIKLNPEGRRHIITAWNPATLDDMALNACHAFVQFNCRALTIEQRYDLYVKQTGEIKIKREFATEEYLDIWVPKYYLDCQLYQRSADSFLGVPYNISSYALLTHIVAKICNMVPGEFIHTFGDVHIYDNHIEQVNEILTRDPEKYQLPELYLQDAVHYSVDAFNIGDCNLNRMIEEWLPEYFILSNYQSYSSIKAELSTGLK